MRGSRAELLRALTAASGLEAAVLGLWDRNGAAYRTRTGDPRITNAKFLFNPLKYSLKSFYFNLLHKRSDQTRNAVFQNVRG